MYGHHIKEFKIFIASNFTIGKGDFVKIYINGRFLTQSITGVQRYALEMTKAIDEIIGNDKDLQRNEYVIITPQNILYSQELKNIRIIRPTWFLI